MKKNAWHEHPEVGAFLRELFGAAWSPELVIELADLSAEAAGTGALRARPEAADSGTAALSELLGRHAAAVRLIERTAGGADFEQVLLLFARGREFDGLEAFLRLGIDRAGRLATDAMRDMLLFLRLRLQALTPSDTGSGRRFLSLCRELGLFVACSGTYVPGLPEFYLRVREDIDRMGDRGGAALMDLLVGSLNVCNVPEHNSAEFHAAMTRGRKTLMELKDAALLEEAEPYLGIWAFVEGEYDEAMSFFSRASRRMRISGRRYFELFFARHWSFAAASRGDFDLAVKLLLSRLREADLDGASSLGRTVRSQLAALYLRTGRIEKALEELDICLTGIGGRTDIASAVTTVRHLAGYHALNGHYQEAWSVLAPVLRKAEAMGYQRPVYLSGALLEILFTLREHGLPPLPCYRFEDELERCLTGPNRLLRGTAQRIQGRLLAAAGRPGQAVHALRSAVSTLVSTHNALEADKTRLELARLILPDNEAEAALLVQEAWKSHAWLEEHYWPAELTRLVPSYLVRGGEEGAADRLLDACREIFGTRRPGITFAEYAGLLLSESARLLGASGSWLFHQARPGAELRLIESRTEPGAESPALRATLDDAAELVAEGEPVILADLAPGEAGHRDMFAGIPLDCRPYGVYVLCLAGPFTEQLRTCLDEAVLADMGRVLAWSCLLALETDRRLAGSGRAEEEDSRMIWASPVMRRFLADADRAAGTDASVLLCGESGAGKEMLARRLHERSGRSGRLVTINMASLQDELFESEFFGHEKGAFTGAMNSKLGLVEMADKGTLFLDELTEASPRVQAKLLRVLQERTFL
ncbi:MAG: sigma 54-interacting transcriptional regulator, partial [Desulfovibrionaceae bacterium]|nr:sigma 54-interacting transcriptional regulator [Desulfovibrionaceae bacterium]